MENPHRKYMVYFMENPIYRYWLVVSTPLKNMTVSWDYYSQYMEKKNMSKPPTRHTLLVFF